MNYIKRLKQGKSAPGDPYRSSTSAVNAKAPITLTTIATAIAMLNCLGNIKPSIEAPALARERTKDALDPFFGVRGSYPLNPRWSLVGYADVGTYAGGDWAWQILAGVNYALSDTRTIKLAMSPLIVGS